MPEFINVRLIDSKIVDLFVDVINMRKAINQYAKNPTDDISDNLVSSVKKASESFESIKYALVNTVKETESKGEDTEVVVSNNINGIEIT